MLIIAEFNHTRRLISSIFWLTTPTHAAVGLWLPKSCNHCIQHGAVGGMAQAKGSRERCSSWTVLYTQRTCALSSWKKKMSSVMCLIASDIWLVGWLVFNVPFQHKIAYGCIRDERLTFVEIVRYPINTVHLLSFQAWRRTSPIFYTATDTVTDLVNIQPVANRQEDASAAFL